MWNTLKFVISYWFIISIYNLFFNFQVPQLSSSKNGWTVWGRTGQSPSTSSATTWEESIGRCSTRCSATASRRETYVSSTLCALSAGITWVPTSMRNSWRGSTYLNSPVPILMPCAMPEVWRSWWKRFVGAKEFRRTLSSPEEKLVTTR